ncbi:MAG: hypothetical protein B7Y43_00630 [Sphingomonas sp. 28-62-20]|nr:MAG: hypothetical protein B7Y43_00630 [Sphingomonas sp. 28-62-20]
MFRAATITAICCVLSFSTGSTAGLAIAPDKTFLSASLGALDLINVPTTPIVPVAPKTDAPSPPVSTDDESNDDPHPAFASLSEAVAAQERPATIDPELGCMAGAIYYEAKGEPLAGQLAVAQVILNRTTSGRFPSSICSVVLQRGQFSFVRGGRMPKVSSTNAAYRTALAIAQIAIDGAWDGPAQAALYFHAKRVSPNWGRARVATIGRHIFYR